MQKRLKSRLPLSRILDRYLSSESRQLFILRFAKYLGKTSIKKINMRRRLFPPIFKSLKWHISVFKTENMNKNRKTENVVRKCSNFPSSAFWRDGVYVYCVPCIKSYDTNTSRSLNCFRTLSKVVAFAFFMNSFDRKYTEKCTFY